MIKFQHQLLLADFYSFISLKVKQYKWYRKLLIVKLTVKQKSLEHVVLSKYNQVLLKTGRTAPFDSLLVVTGRSVAIRVLVSSVSCKINIGCSSEMLCV